MEYNKKGLYISNKNKINSKSQSNFLSNVTQPIRNPSSQKIPMNVNKYINHGITENRNIFKDEIESKTNSKNESQNINIRMKINNINFKNTNEFFKRNHYDITNYNRNKSSDRYTVFDNTNEKSNLEENIGGVISKIKNELDEISKHINTSKEKIDSIKEIKKAPLKLNNFMSARTNFKSKSPSLMITRNDNKNGNNLILDKIRSKNKSLANELKTVKGKFLDFKLDKNYNTRNNPKIDNRTFELEGDNYIQTEIESLREKYLNTQPNEEVNDESDISIMFKEKLTEYEKSVQDLKIVNKNDKKTINYLKLNLNKFLPDDLNEENYEIVHSYSCQYEKSKWFLISSKNRIQSYWILEEFLIDNNFDFSQFENKISLDEIELKYESIKIEFTKYQNDVLNIKKQFSHEINLKEEQLLNTKKELEKINSKSLAMVETVNKLNLLLKEVKIENKELRVEIQQKSKIQESNESKLKDVSNNLEFYIQELNKIKQLNENLINDKESNKNNLLNKELKDELEKLETSHKISIESYMNQNLKLEELLNDKNNEIQNFKSELEEMISYNNSLKNHNEENKNLLIIISQDVNNHKEEIEIKKNEIALYKDNLTKEQNKNNHLNDEISVLHKQIDSIPSIINEEVNKYKNKLSKSSNNEFDDKIKKLNEKLQNSILEKTKIENKLAEFHEENNRLKQKNKDLLKNLIDYDTNYKELEIKVSTLDDKIQEHLLTIEIQNRTISKLNDKIKEETKDKQEMDKNKIILENVIKDMKNEIKRLRCLQEVNKKLKTQLEIINLDSFNYLNVPKLRITEIKQIINNNEENFDEIPALMNRISKLTERVESRDEKDKSFTSQIQNMKNENNKVIDDLNKQIILLREDLDKERENLKLKENDLINLNIKLNQKSIENENLNNSYKENILKLENKLNQNILNYQNEINDLNIKLEKLLYELKEKENLVTKLNQELIKERSKRELIISNNNYSNEKVNIYEDKIKENDIIIFELNKKICYLEDSTDNLKNKEQELNDKIKSLGDNILIISSELEFNKTRESKSKQENENIISKLNESTDILKNKEKELNDKIKSLEKNISIILTELELIKKRESKLKQENDNITCRLNESIKEMENIKNENNSLVDREYNISKEIETLKNNLNLNEDTINNLNLMNKDLLNNIKTSEENLNKTILLNKDLINYKNENIQIIKRLEKENEIKIENFNVEINNKTEEINYLKIENENLINNNKNLYLITQEMGKEVEILKESELNLKVIINNLENDKINLISKDKEECENLQKIINLSKNKNEINEDKYVYQTEKVKKYELDIINLESKIIDLENELDKTLKFNEESKDKMKNEIILQNKIIELENLIREKTDEIILIKEDITKKDEEILELHIINSETDTKIEKLNEENTNFHELNIKLKNENKEYKKQLSENNKNNQMRISQNNLLISSDLKVSNNFEVNFTQSSHIPDELQTKMIEIEIIKEELHYKDSELIKFREDYFNLQLTLKDLKDIIEEKEKDIENFKKINDNLLDKLNSSNNNSKINYQTSFVKTCNSFVDDEEDEEITNYKTHIQHLKDLVKERENELIKLAKENENYKNEIDCMLNPDNVNRDSFRNNDNSKDSEINYYKTKYYNLLNYEGRIDNFEVFIQNLNKILQSYKAKNKENEEACIILKSHLNIYTESLDSYRPPQKQNSKKSFFSGLFSNKK